MPSINPLDARFTEWTEWLDGNLPDGRIDHNSIAGVIYAVVQEMAIHEAYMELCKTVPTTHLGVSLFYQSTAFSYFEIQAIRIRKLTESNPHSGRRNLDVYSMKRIVDDIIEQRNNLTMTRGNISRHFGYPATAASTERQFNDYMSRLIGSGSFSTHLVDAMSLHRTLKKVCTSRGHLRRQFIRELENRVSEKINPAIMHVKLFVDKNIAHSASELSRQQAARQIILETAKVKKAIQGIVECFYALEMFVKRAGYASLIPAGWDNHLKGLDRTEQATVRAKFQEIDELCKQWQTNAYKLLND